MNRVALLVAGFGLGACAYVVGSGRQTQAVANMVDGNGKSVGSIRFQTLNEGTFLSVELTGLTPGEHGIHVHTNSTCTNTTDANGNVVTFGGAGSHFDPMNTGKHGGLARSEPETHAGDLQNIVADTNGNAKLELVSNKITISEGPRSVLNKSLIVHANRDDLTTQPSGNSGPRVACGVIKLLGGE